MILIKNDLDFIQIASNSKFTDSLVGYYENDKKFTKFLTLVKKASIYNLNSIEGLSASQVIMSKLIAKNMSEADLSKKIHVSRAYVNMIMSSKRIPSIEMAKKIGKILEFN
jgi:antitoxin component HigA of HigAB toxin-antitoxin module